MKLRASLRHGLPLSALAALLTFSSGRVHAQSQLPTFKLLYMFQRAGGDPGGLVELSPGHFLGVINNSPGIFAMNSAGALKVIYYFPQSQLSLGVVGLTAALNRRTYGAAANFGPTTTFSELFSVAANASVATYPYNAATQGGLIVPAAQSPDDHLYAIFGIDAGTPIFNRLNYDGNPNLLYTFSAAQGRPALMFLGGGGDFYGLTLMNNTYNAGIFHLTTAGSFSWVLPNFLTHGVNYGISLIQASSGNFYGTLPIGGSANAGSIYEVTQNGTMRTLYEFQQRNVGIPEALIEASDGMLYGMTRGEYNTGFNGYSGMFRLDPSTGQLQTLGSFKDGQIAACECQLMQGSDGRIYGTSLAGGTYNLGTIFMMDAGLPPPKPRVSLFTPQAGAVGRRVLLWGRNFLGITAVSFNGTPAEFEAVSWQGVWAKVPSGATSGPIAITTPNGSYTTAQSFTIQ